MISRREWIRIAGGMALAAPASRLFACAPMIAPTPVTVYKSPTCGCCRAWVTHLRSHDFAVTAHDVEDVAPIKKQHGVPAALGSCHTALVAGYVIEGHVPGDVIRQLLASRPKVVGLAVPGMPAGSPGMEGPTKERYDVLAFDKAGGTKVFATR